MQTDKDLLEKCRCYLELYDLEWQFPDNGSSRVGALAFLHAVGANDIISLVSFFLNDNGQIVNETTMNAPTTGGNTSTRDFLGWIGDPGESIRRIDITSSSYILDEITAYNVSQVPLPAAFWLFGSAIIGLSFINRRKL